MSNKVINNIDSSKNQRTKNLLTALNKAFDELNITTVWTALGPKEVQFNCCSNCIFGSQEFDNKDYKITYNIQDLDSYNEAYRDNRETHKYYERDEHKGEFVYLQHSIPRSYDSVEQYRLYKELISIFNKHGIYVYWNWSNDNKLRVCLDKFVAENNWEE